ncbi:MAG: GGDEF domain-containing protein [Gemmatimonadales bacterium]
MNGVVWLLGGMAAGAAGAMIFRRGQADAAPRIGADPVLLPDPALRWLADARRAQGLWVAHPPREGSDQPQWDRVVPGGRLSPTAAASVESRLAALRDRAASGAERIDAGVLLYASAGGLIAGLLLPGDTAPDVLRQGGDDLVALLDGLGRKPLLDKALSEDDGPVESLGSIGLRLAYQLERILTAEVIVAVEIQGTVRVIGTSGRADRRLLDTFAQPGSPLFQVASGEVPSLTSIADPLGGIVHDRRSHFTPAIIFPIRHFDETVGAVAFWTDDNGEPIGPVIAEVQEALRNAGPRMVRARKLEEMGNAAVTDPLTGLKNRRGLDEAMRRVGISQGTLIYADLDKFKLLNDTMGHHAGDAALVHFSRLVHDVIRGGDTAARIGGEEFAIWLPGASMVYGAKVAERIRIRLGTTTWDWQGRTWPLSASFGVAALPDTSRSLENLPAQADAALMEAKRQGRDRVETARPL